MTDVHEKIDRYDDSDYLRWLRELPDQLEDAYRRGMDLQLEEFACRSVLVCGMGGSGIAGALLRQFLFYRSSVPILTNRFYRVPGWVDESTLVITVSYSGNTEETLGADRDARRAGARRLAVTSGGELGERAAEDDLPVVTVPSEMPPRASVAYLFVPLLFALQQVGVSSVPGEDELDQAVRHLKDINDDWGPERSDNEAVEIARRVTGTHPIVYGSQEVTAALAQRFKNQLNENAKVFACSGEFPEMNHNEIMALEHLGEHPGRYHGLLLRDRGEHNRVERRFSILRSMLQENLGGLDTIKSRGRSLLSRFFTLILQTDYVSYYLALLEGEDPSSIGYIEQLKEQL